MKIETMICDKCGNTCKGDYFSVFRNSDRGTVLGKCDICENCYRLMLSAIEDEEAEDA